MPYNDETAPKWELLLAIVVAVAVAVAMCFGVAALLWG